ncbi:hypothetical protein [Paenibacillus rubinfantis]|uniref:hypothetical protein n=1 Tax=Paenibacillus rubinfantis TaxID=1720296 RepID=UPI00073E8A06|nr:hypothetical protein [Paenibacillus rubinfantis]
MTMPPLQAGEEAKLRLIDAISQSQLAMARILGSLADVTELSPDAARHIAGNIDRLTKYQEAMARTVCGLTFHRVKYGTPSSPWMIEACYAAYDVTRGEQEEE